MRTVLGKSVAYCLAYLFLFSLTVPAMAWPPPCPDCLKGENCDEYVGDCVDDYDCSGCESCVDCWCEDDESKCPGECDTCDDGTCTDHDYNCSSIDCEICNDGVCEDRCPALGKHCWLGTCVECRDVLDCELCWECINHECVHPCDECYYPKYCGYACACVECYYGEEDTTTCSTANSTTECYCSINIFNPCSSPAESVVYSGATLTSCTGPDCDSVDVLCYTTYPGCKVSGSYQPLKWCSANDVGAPPPAPWPYSCQLNLDIPGPGCWTCVNSFESGDPTDEPQGDCPVEAWP